MGTLSKYVSAAHILCAAILIGTPALAQAEAQQPPSLTSFPALPLPPEIDGLVGFPQTSIPMLSGVWAR